MPLNRSFSLIIPRARQCLDLRAVLHHLFQADQSFFAERRQHLREQPVQLFLFLHTKVRQRVIVTPPAPSATGTRDHTRSAARRTDPLAVGVHPQTDQQLRIERRTPALFRAALDG